MKMMKTKKKQVNLVTFSRKVVLVMLRRDIDAITLVGAGLWGGTERARQKFRVGSTVVLERVCPTLFVISATEILWRIEQLGFH